MKQILLAITLIIFGLSNVNAQTKGDIELGAGIGASASSIGLITEKNTDISGRISYNIALSGEYYLSEKWGIKTHLIYDNKGWDQGNDDESINVATNYITIPLRINWHFGGDNRNWYLGLGLYAGFLTSVSSENPILAPYKIEDFNTIDAGVVVGVGYKYEISEKLKLYGELDIQSGFVSVFKDNNDFRNLRAGINLGVLYDL